MFDEIAAAGPGLSCPALKACGDHMATVRSQAADSIFQRLALARCQLGCAMQAELNRVCQLGCAMQAELNRVGQPCFMGNIWC